MRVEAGRLGQLGWIWALRDGGGVLREVHLSESSSLVPVGAEVLGEDLRVALEEYVTGEDGGLRRIVLAPASSTFAQAFREALWSIPRGQVRTYGQVACAMGKPKAARAVGRACATNPLPLVVPCHRVVAALGLGGFGPGLAIKRALLSQEGIDVALCAGFR
jgi:methylated-DNA-[protein]-cysteine S-methyltransferase